jgi:Winged helix DNA-binding domain
VLGERLSAQLLTGTAAGRVEDVVCHLLAIQAQDPRGARLAVRARSTGLTAADVDQTLTGDRSMVISTLNRGTLHLVGREDYWWLQALTTPSLATGNSRRLEQEGVSPGDADRAVTIVERALESDGPLHRDALRERVRAGGIRVEGQALVHVLFLATLRGLIVRGPMVDGEQAYVLVRDWLGRPPPARDHDSMLSELARRYLVGHGPAAPPDLAKWAGITLGDARRGLAAIGSSLAPRADGLCALAGVRPAIGLPRPRLLGSFDPVLHGWVSRTDIVGSHQSIVTTNGIFRPFALVRGRAVATWTLSNGEVRLRPFAPLARSVEAALEADAARVVTFLAGRPAT